MASMAGSGSGSGRLSIACQRCRRRKTKCDLQMPRCSACVKASVECVSSQQPHLSRQDQAIPRGFVETLEAKLSSLERQARESLNRSPGFGNSTASGYHEANLQNISGQAIPDGINITNLVTPDVLISKESKAFNLTRMTEAAIRNTMSPAVGRLYQCSDADLAQLYTGLVESGKIESYLKAYQASVQDHLPFLDGTYLLSLSTITSVQDVQRDRPIHLTVLAVGALLSGPRDVGTRYQIFMLAMNARKYLASILQFDTIETLQLLLLWTIFSMFDPIGGNTWQLCGLCLRTAIVLGLHKETYYTSNPGNAIVTRRAFWVTYVIDRCVSFALGRPFGIDDQDISTNLRDNADGQRMSELPELTFLISKHRSTIPSFSSATSAAEMDAIRKTFVAAKHVDLNTHPNLTYLLGYHLLIWSLGPPFPSGESSVQITRKVLRNYFDFIATCAQTGLIFPWVTSCSLLHATLLEEFLETILLGDPEANTSARSSMRGVAEMLLANTGCTHRLTEKFHLAIKALPRSINSPFPAIYFDAEDLENISTKKLYRSLFAALDST